LDLDEGFNGLKEERRAVEQIWPGDVEYLVLPIGKETEGC
jgi:hypothetical protein